MSEPSRARPAEQLGRYQVGEEVAAGGMATVHLGRLLGPAGITRVVAIKRMHAHIARDPAARRMFLDEARLAYRIRHPNVVSTLDVVEHDSEVSLVLEYVAGETLAKLLEAFAAAGERMPPPVLSSIVNGALLGLHAAHQVEDERGEPLNVIHRDISPQNLIVGTDGVTRVLDFGIAKAQGRVQETTGIAVRGKLRYLSPEQIRRAPLDRRVDLFAAGVVLWEALTGRRLFDADDIAGVLDAVLHAPIPPPSSVTPALPLALDQLVLRALARDPAQRPATAQAFAEELEAILPKASNAEVARTVQRWASAELDRRSSLVANLTKTKQAVTPRSPVHLRALDDADADKTEPEVMGLEDHSGETERSAPGTGPAAVTIAIERSRSASRAKRIGGFVAVLLLASGSVLLLVLAAGTPQPLPKRPAPPPSIATAEAAAALPEPVSTRVESPAPSATVSARPLASIKAPARRQPVARPAGAARPDSAADPGCAFPFTIGPGGVRIPKKACF